MWALFEALEIHQEINWRQSLPGSLHSGMGRGKRHAERPQNYVVNMYAIGRQWVL